MRSLIKSSLMAAALSVPSLVLAAPLQFDSALTVGQRLSGTTHLQQLGDQLGFSVQGQQVLIRGLGSALKLPQQAVQLQFERRAHPTGPQNWLTLTQGEQRWLLASGLSSGATLVQGRQLVWQASGLQLSNGVGVIESVPTDGDLGLQQGWRECLRVLDIRLPVTESSDSEPVFDVMYWMTRAIDCR